MCTRAVLSVCALSMHTRPIGLCSSKKANKKKSANCTICRISCRTPCKTRNIRQNIVREYHTEMRPNCSDGRDASYRRLRQSPSQLYHLSIPIHSIVPAPPIHHFELCATRRANHDERKATNRKRQTANDVVHTQRQKKSTKKEEQNRVKVWW